MTHPGAYLWTCQAHAGEFLKDCVDDAGAISHQCRVCVAAQGGKLVVANVVRGLHRIKKARA